MRSRDPSQSCRQERNGDCTPTPIPTPASTNSSPSNLPSIANRPAKSRMMQLFGFETESLRTWSSFVKLMNRPEDPSALAAFRIAFGILMMCDIPNERGMAEADIEFGDPLECRFPLFDFLKPLAMEYMVLLYGVLFLAAFCIAIGFRYGMYFRLAMIILYAPPGGVKNGKFVTLTPFKKIGLNQ